MAKQNSREVARRMAEAVEKYVADALTKGVDSGTQRRIRTSLREGRTQLETDLGLAFRSGGFE